MTSVREAMLTDPRRLQASASARDAGEMLLRPEVRSVLVVDGERLLGVVTPEALVAGVVAAGRDPRSTPVGDVAVECRLVLAPEQTVEDAYQAMEEADVERAPVLVDGRLIGVLSRSALRRRLAEDEPPDPDPDGSA